MYIQKRRISSYFCIYRKEILRRAGFTQVRSSSRGHLNCDGAKSWLSDCLRAMRYLLMGKADQANSTTLCKQYAFPKLLSHYIGGRKHCGDGYAELETLDFKSIEQIRQYAARRMVRVSRGWLLVFCTTEGVASWRDAIEAAGGKKNEPAIGSSRTPRRNSTGRGRRWRVKCLWPPGAALDMRKRTQAAGAAPTLFASTIHSATGDTQPKSRWT